ncbi:hypothetical protein LWI29_033001 [Acer saccharum]|uniref:RNase H type-1 domain-containing protein n=1 Tax=Acer saccharum TaxID=4024 RepID=A0AA39VAI8_ACESA|nr:hypothetical protein LWI29_033001 [Acer saccharum]
MEMHGVESSVDTNDELNKFEVSPDMDYSAVDYVPYSSVVGTLKEICGLSYQDVIEKKFDSDNINFEDQKNCFNWIPTKYNIARREILTDGNCIACKTSLETTMHALWDCKKLRHIQNEWSHLKAATTGNHANFMDLVIHWFSVVNEEDKMLFCVLVWRIWGCHNDLLHNSPIQIFLRKGERTGIGVVVRDSDGEVLACCAQRLKTNMSIKAANLLAIQKGIHFGVDWFSPM